MIIKFGSPRIFFRRALWIQIDTWGMKGCENQTTKFGTKVLNRKF